MESLISNKFIFFSIIKILNITNQCSYFLSSCMHDINMGLSCNPRSNFPLTVSTLFQNPNCSDQQSLSQVQTEKSSVNTFAWKPVSLFARKYTRDQGINKKIVMYLSLFLAVVMLGLSQGAPVADAEADASPGPFFFEVEAHDMMLRYDVHPEEALSLMHDINNTQVAFDSSDHTDDSPESAYLTGKWKNEIYQPMVAEVDRAFEVKSWTDKGRLTISLLHALIFNISFSGPMAVYPHSHVCLRCLCPQLLDPQDMWLLSDPPVRGQNGGQGRGSQGVVAHHRILSIYSYLILTYTLHFIDDHQHTHTYTYVQLNKVMMMTLHILKAGNFSKPKCPITPSSRRPNWSFLTPPLLSVSLVQDFTARGATVSSTLSPQSTSNFQSMES